MKAAYIERTGPALEVIRFGELPDPQPTATQLLIEVGAVAVNPIDTYIRNGANYWEFPKPFILGCDMAGTVVSCGSQVLRYKPGDRVWCSNQGLQGRQGTFSELCAIEETWLHPTPHNVSDEAAAACALVGITAQLGLLQHAKLQPGETIFVNGGTGGVGSMVVQMAKAIGARVIATAGSDEKCKALQALGADVSINYRTADIATYVSGFAPGGVQVYWETVREPDFDKIVAYMAERGRIILMAGRDSRPAFPVGPFYVKGCSLLGFVMFKATHAEIHNAGCDINHWLSSGQLKALISHRLALSESAQAHHLQEQNTLHKSGTMAGKIVLTP